MKALIWIGCFFVVTIFNILLGYATGIKAGYFVFYFLVCFIAKKMCNKWDEHKEAKEMKKKISTSTNAPVNEITPTTDDVKFCRKCGEKLIDNSQFCRKCGTKVLIISDADVQPQKFATDTENSKPKKNKGTIISYIALGILLVATIVAAIFIISGLSSTDKGSGGTYDGNYSSSYQETYDDTSTIKPNNSQKSNNNQGATQKSPQINTSKYICLETGCKNSVSASEEYCAEHKCAKSRCDRQKTTSSPYCSLHSCSDTGCDNLADGTGLYCSEHTCVENSCLFKKSFGSNYCSTHKCIYVGCHNSQSGYSFYCYEHKCAKSGCNSQKSALSDYCLLHD